MNLAISDALTRAKRALADLEGAIAAEAGEEPIPVKVAAHRYSVGLRSMQRAAESGCGIKVRGKWHVFPSRLALPVVNR